LINNTFREIEDAETFVKSVENYLKAPQDHLNELLKCKIELDRERVIYAHGEYKQSIDKFRVYLQSGDPDHYKRAGALLHALCVSMPIIKVDFEPHLDDVDTLNTPVGMVHNEAEETLTFGKFFNEYANEFLAFGMAFDICLQYETDPKTLDDFEFVRTMCAYLQINNSALNPEALFMMFKCLLL